MGTLSMDRHGHSDEKCNKYPCETNDGIGDMLRRSHVPYDNYEGVDGDCLDKHKATSVGDGPTCALIHAQEWPMQIPSPQAVPQFLRQINQ